MSNPFFTWSFDVTPGNTARSRPVENEFAAIGTGFAGVWAHIQRGLFAPTGETLAALPNRATRAGKTLGFNSSGDPVATLSATSDEMAAAIVAAAGAATAATTATEAAATVTNSTSYIQQLMLAQGVL